MKNHGVLDKKKLLENSFLGILLLFLKRSLRMIEKVENPAPN
jgi:hypothetical protein